MSSIYNQNKAVLSWVAYCLVRLRDRCCNPHQQRLEFMWNSWHRVNFTGTHFKETRNQKRFDSVSRCSSVWSINSAFISCTGLSFPTFADLNTTSTAKSNVIEFPLVCTHFWAAFAPFPLDMSSLRAVCPVSTPVVSSAALAGNQHVFTVYTVRATRSNEGSCGGAGVRLLRLIVLFKFKCCGAQACVDLWGSWLLLLLCDITATHTSHGVNHRLRCSQSSSGYLIYVVKLGCAVQQLIIIDFIYFPSVFPLRVFSEVWSCCDKMLSITLPETRN